MPHQFQLVIVSPLLEYDGYMMNRIQDLPFYELRKPLHDWLQALLRYPIHKLSSFLEFLDFELPTIDTPRSQEMLETNALHSESHSNHRQKSF